jgi:hypothetical protein
MTALTASSLSSSALAFSFFTGGAVGLLSGISRGGGIDGVLDFPDATFNEPYSETSTISVSGATFVVSGLPAGLVSNFSGSNLTISGVPT